eukprot:c8912_g1_i2.p1 GENE.c8912_g1_i2~~c8912_g1_i2.p1  ORF type:complete len:269 (-),score=42.40 c8912_g1_i2:833-1603(-)
MADPEHRDHRHQDDKHLSSAANAFVPRWKTLQGPRSGSDDEDHSHSQGGIGNRSLSFGARSPNHGGSPQQPMPFARTGNWQVTPSPFMQTSPASPRKSTFSRSASWREEALRRETPDHPKQSSSDDKPSKAITVEHKLIKPGTYSTWIRVLSADIGPAQLATVLGRCEESNNHGAIHVYLREKFINRQLVQQLKSQGYKFHHYVEDTQTFVYGKRPQDTEDGRELMNATCKELIGALVVSPDEKQVSAHSVDVLSD